MLDVLAGLIPRWWCSVFCLIMAVCNCAYIHNWLCTFDRQRTVEDDETGLASEVVTKWCERHLAPQRYIRGTCMNLSVNCSNIGFLFLQEELVYFGMKGFFWPPPLLLLFFFLRCLSFGSVMLKHVLCENSVNSFLLHASITWYSKW